MPVATWTIGDSPSNRDDSDDVFSFNFRAAWRRAIASRPRIPFSISVVEVHSQAVFLVSQPKVVSSQDRGRGAATTMVDKKFADV
jgi:hypothetical protein